MKLVSKLTIRFAVLAVAIVVVAGMVAVWNRSRVMNRIAQIRQAGDPASVADLDLDWGPAAADKADAAAILATAVDRMGDLYNRVEPDLGSESFDWKTGVDDQKLKELSRQFEQNQDLVEAFERASRCSHGRWFDSGDQSPIAMTEQLNRIAVQLKTIARFNGVHVRLLAAQGQHDQAALASISQLRLCRVQDQLPLLIGFLVNTAARRLALDNLNGLLQNAALSADTHRVIDDELALHDTMDRFVGALKTERAFGIESIRDLPISTTAAMDNYLDVVNEQIALGNEPHYRTVGAAWTPATGLAASLSPAIDQSRLAMNRNLAIIRCVRVLNAIKARRPSPDEDSVIIDSLGLTGEAIVDPFTGDPLVVRATDNGWMIYSLGENQTDDGCSTADQSDIGIVPPAIATAGSAR